MPPLPAWRRIAAALRCVALDGLFAAAGLLAVVVPALSAPTNFQAEGNLPLTLSAPAAVRGHAVRVTGSVLTRHNVYSVRLEWGSDGTPVQGTLYAFPESLSKSFAFDVKVPADGRYRFTASTGGSPREDGETLWILFDATAPAIVPAPVRFTGGGSRAYTALIAASIGDGDGSGVKRVAWQVRPPEQAASNASSAWAILVPPETGDTYEMAVPLADLSPGPVDVVIRATDNLGNAAEKIITFTNAARMAARVAMRPALEYIPYTLNKPVPGPPPDYPLAALDRFSYRASVEFAGETPDVQLQLTLPPGLERDPTRPLRNAGERHDVLERLLRKDWDGVGRQDTLFHRLEGATGLHMAANRRIAIDVPVRVVANISAGVHAISTSLIAYSENNNRVTPEGVASNAIALSVARMRAADALAASITVHQDGNDGGVIYGGVAGKVRLEVRPKQAIRGMQISFTMPAGLTHTRKFQLLPGIKSDAMNQLINAQLGNWNATGIDIGNIDLRPDDLLQLEMPVGFAGTLPVVKVSGAPQQDSFSIGAHSFTDVVRVRTEWKVAWIAAPQGKLAAPLSYAYDLLQPSGQPVFDRISGGYDTADPARWNRNTLHCAAPDGDTGAACRFAPKAGGDAGDSRVALEFTEAGSGQKTVLFLRGRRHLRAADGSGGRDVPLDDADNRGADAETAYSLELPASALAKIPAAGRWRAGLRMQLRDAAGKPLGFFEREIALQVTDRGNTTPRPPTLSPLAGSWRDLDLSDGYSAGDIFTYRLRYEAARDMAAVQLGYVPPPGLLPFAAPVFVDGDVRDNGLIDPRWPASGTLLQVPLSMRRGQYLTIDMALKVASAPPAAAISRATVAADDYPVLTSAALPLAVQIRFAAALALRLHVAVVAIDTADGSAGTTGGEPGTDDDNGPARIADIARDTPFLYRVRLSASRWKVEDPTLRYRLPAGLRRTAAPIAVERLSRGDPQRLAADDSALLNPKWDGDGEDNLLARGAQLAAGDALHVTIPLMAKAAVRDGIALRSEIVAGGGNMTGAVIVSDWLTVQPGVPPGDSMAIIKTATPPRVQPGETVTYRIRVINRGRQDVRQLAIQDTVPPQTTLIGASCGDVPAEKCRRYTQAAGGAAGIAASVLCASSSSSSPAPAPPLLPASSLAPLGQTTHGRRLVWCVDGGILAGRAYTVDYQVRVDAE